MEDSKDLENRIAPSPMQSLQGLQGAADPTITVIGPRVAWKDKRALELERQLKNTAGFGEEKFEERTEFQMATPQYRALNVQSPANVTITDRQDSPTFIQELLSKFSSADNTPRSVTELISSMSQRPLTKETTKPRVLSPSSASKMSGQIRKEEGTEEVHVDSISQSPTDNIIAPSSKRVDSSVGDILHGSFKGVDTIQPQKNSFEFAFPMKHSFIANDLATPFPLSPGKSHSQTLQGGTAKAVPSEKEPQTPRSLFDSLVFSDQPIWRPPPEPVLSPSKGEVQFTPHYFANSEDFRFGEATPQDPRRTPYPTQIHHITEETPTSSFLQPQQPHPSQKGVASQGVFDSLKFPLTEGSSVLGPKFVESPGPSMSHGTSLPLTLPSLSSASLQFMEGNMPSQIFELSEQPTQIQRKCYKKENRCLLPNPLQIVLKREYLQASNYILDGVVSVKLVSEDGKDYPKQSSLQSVDEGLKHSLDLTKGTNFSLKIEDTTEGANVRLLFTITYRVRGNRLCEERVISQPFEVCSNSKRKRKLTSQLQQQQKAESGGNV